jgi:hypothetical protein
VRMGMSRCLVVFGGGEYRGLGRGGQRDMGSADPDRGDGVEQAAGVKRDGDRLAVQLAADGVGAVGLIAAAGGQLDLDVLEEIRRIAGRRRLSVVPDLPGAGIRLRTRPKMPKIRPVGAAGSMTARRAGLASTATGASGRCPRWPPPARPAGRGSAPGRAGRC